MKIDPSGVEYVHIPVTGTPFDANTLSVTFDGGLTWHDTTWNDNKTVATILVGGPDAPPGDHVVLARGRHTVKARLSDTPEVVIRNTNSIIDVRA